MQKSKRQQALLNLISAEKIANQSDLAERLRVRNFDVTQASVSRDLDELGIIKTGGVYTLPRKSTGAAAFDLASVAASGENLVVVRCGAGLASAAAVAIDEARMPEIIGTIAGDDTIFIAVKDAHAQKAAVKKIWEIFNG